MEEVAELVKASASPVYHDAYALGELDGESTSGGAVPNLQLLYVFDLQFALQVLLLMFLSFLLAMFVEDRRAAASATHGW